MILSLNNKLYASVMLAVGIYMCVCAALADEKALDIQMYLPLIEKNLFGQKVLDVRYSSKPRQLRKESIVYPEDVHLVYDAESGRFRQETKEYRPNETNRYYITVDIWDGNKFLSWRRIAFSEPRSSLPGKIVRETPGAASIISKPPIPLPYLVGIYYLPDARPLSEALTEKNLRRASIVGDTITIETEDIKSSFSKSTGAVHEIIYYFHTLRTKNNNKMFYETLNLSNHVECSGFLVPLRIIRTYYDKSGEVDASYEFSVDPQTLRMLDTVDDSVFSVALPAGCYVDDDIGKRSYTVTTIDALPNDVEAVRKALEKMLEQAQEQKAAVEQK